jgi:hypothetical protein
VGNWVGLIVTTNSPKLGAATGQESAEVISINKDACRYRQFHHLLWGVGTIKLFLNLRVTIYLMAEVIQGIQQGL